MTTKTQNPRKDLKDKADYFRQQAAISNCRSNRREPNRIRPPQYGYQPSAPAYEQQT